MQRRSFLALLLGAPVSSARADEKRRFVIFLIGLPLDHPVVVSRFAIVRRQLVERGWTEGVELRFEVRSVSSEPEALARTAAAIVREAPDLIGAGSSNETAAVLAATRTIPVLFTTASDPIGSGFTRSLERPDGNATGFSNNDPGMAPKWLELLREIAPATRRIALVFNPATAAARGAGYFARLGPVAAEAGLELVGAPLNELAEADALCAGLGAQPDTSLIFLPDSYTYRYAGMIAGIVARHRLPAIYPYEIFVQNGGLVSYTGGRNETDELTATYVDLILRGTRIADLPVQFSRSFELVVNERAAAALGLAIPDVLRIRATRIVA